MGLIDNIRGLFSGSKNTQVIQPQVNESYEKSRLANKIVDMVDEIKRINSFDSSIWNLSNVSSFELKRKNIDELQRLNSNLESRLSELKKQSQRGNSGMADIEAAKWTGETPKGMNKHDLDYFQQGDDYRG